MRCKVPLALLASLWVVGGASAQPPMPVYDPVTRIMTIKSGDSFDIVAVFIEGPDVSTVGCNLCDGMNLPGDDVGLSDASSWTVGFFAGSTQWIRTNPLSGRGFTGVMSDFWTDGNDMPQAWPQDFFILDFPDEGLGIATYPQGTQFSDFGTVTFVANDGSTFETSLVIWPEPRTGGFAAVVLGLFAQRYRRRFT